MKLIKNKVEEIEKYLGVQLKLCKDSPGIYFHNGNRYFNIILDTPVFNSIIYTKLLNILKTNIIKNVEPNGYKRLAIFF